MSGRWTQRRQAVRTILNGNKCINPGSVFDPISGRIAQELGYEVGIIGGSTISLAVLGAPDLIVLTLTEFADQVKRISRACDLPLLVDADHGYGNALNVMRTVDELEMAGVAALSIEDTVLPKQFDADSKAKLIDREEGVGKMRAAIAARRDADLVICGRTSAPALTSVDDACARIRAYESVGVDAIFLVGVKTREQLDQLAEAVSIPLILGSTPPEIADLSYLTSRNVRISLQGHRPFAAGVQALYEALSALKSGTAPADLQNVAPPEMMDRLTRKSEYMAALQKFLSRLDDPS